MAIVAVSISPTGTGSGTSVGAYVAEALRVARAQDRVAVHPGPMFTTLEGDLDEVMALVRAMQEAVFAMGAQRVGTVLKIDDRRDKDASVASKLERIDG